MTDRGIRYRLAPATRMLWRDPDVVQFECGDRSVVVEGLTTRTARGLTNPTADPPDPQCEPALEHLAELGLVWRCDDDSDPAADRDGTGDPRSVATPYLAGELAALTTRLGPAAATTLRARRDVHVAVHGAGRVGPAIGAVLAASGVGAVHFTTDTDVKTWSSLPGGVLPDETGQRLAAAARSAVRRATPGRSPDARAARREAPLRPDEADFAVLALDTPVDDDRRDALHNRAMPHLLVALHPAGAVVGPLVLPGLTSCLRCLDRHRRDRDDAWPRLAVQLTVARRHGPASEAATATMAAGLAAAQVLSYLDGGQPASIEGTLELRPPDWRIRRRSWPVHPSCGCAP